MLVRPGLCPLCGPTAFVARGAWLRESYACRRCGSIPRMRALVAVLKRELPAWRTLQIHESSPDGPSSRYLAAAPGYVPSQWFPDVPSGTLVDGVLREDLQDLSLPDASVDLVVTQDVLEHVLDPDAAWREIARVLRPGGAHLWTVPIYAGRPTVRRVAVDGTLLMDADYHGNPLGGGSLVVHEWGVDVVERADAASGMRTTHFAKQSALRGVRGEMTDVLLSRKLLDPASSRGVPLRAGTGTREKDNQEWTLMKHDAEIVEKIIAEVPSDFHASGSLSQAVLRRIAELHRDTNAKVSAETGCGLTTLILSQLSDEHTSFTADFGDSLSKTRDHTYFNRQSTTFVVNSTQISLPTHEFKKELDFVIIDGPHAYPFPDLEYFYFYPQVRRGGVLVLDDIHIPTIGHMYDFMRDDEMWEHLGDVETTAFFRRTAAPTLDPHGDGWPQQRYNRRYFEYPSALDPHYGEGWYEADFGRIPDDVDSPRKFITTVQAAQQTQLAIEQLQAAKALADRRIAELQQEISDIRRTSGAH